MTFSGDDVRGRRPRARATSSTRLNFALWSAVVRKKSPVLPELVAAEVLDRLGVLVDPVRPINAAVP